MEVEMATIDGAGEAQGAHGPNKAHLEHAKQLQNIIHNLEKAQKDIEAMKDAAMQGSAPSNIIGYMESAAMNVAGAIPDIQEACNSMNA
jgi:hypothetical protein